MAKTDNHQLKALQERLAQAVRREDASLIRDLLLGEGLTSVPRALGRKAICLVLRRGYEQTVQRLLDAGADPNAARGDKHSPAYLATLYKQPSILKALLNAGASPDDQAEAAPLLCAVNSSTPELVEILLAAGVRLDAVDHVGANAVHRAADFSNEEILALLLKHGSPVDARDPHGLTAMHYAARAGEESTFQVLLDHGADIEARTDTGLTPALHAASQARLDSFETLVRLGADALAVADGQNAFDLALRSTHLWADEMGAHLLKHYPSLAPTGEALDAAFVEAVRNGYAEIATKLAALGADVGQKPGGRSLMQCAPKNNDAMKRLLRSLKLGESVEAAMDNSSELPIRQSHSGPVL